MGTKDLPIGIQDFKAIRDDDFYYVDKSMLISQVLGGSRRSVSLFTRPRRFGKSLNLSMLDAFFNIEYKGNTWFDGLEISEHHEYDAYRNAYPVILVNFKEFDTDSYEQFLISVKSSICMLYDKYAYLSTSANLDEYAHRIFSSPFGNIPEDFDYRRSLKYLVSMLRKHHGRKVIVLIDEYDSPMNDSYGKDIADKVRDFMRSMLISVLKGNDDVEFAVVTGVMQIAKESIFSGLNNLRVNNILSERSDEMFGFTDEEVKRICIDYGHPEKYDEAKEWYDGYRFGNADIYNPWSLLNYADMGFVPDTYWAGTSGNSIISDLLDCTDVDIYADLTALAEGGSVVSRMDTTVSYGGLNDSKDAIYSVMAMSGYLKASNDPNGKTVFTIPNKELYSVFADTVMSRLGDAAYSAKDFIRSLLKGDTDAMVEDLRKMLEDSVSCRILDDEHPYQTFILGMLMFVAGRYKVTGDFESGKGYHDIRMERIGGDSPNVLIEIKRTSSGSGDVQRLAEDALNQIHEMDYTHGLKGKTILYGVAFDGKVPTIVSECIQL